MTTFITSTPEPGYREFIAKTDLLVDTIVERTANKTGVYMSRSDGYKILAYCNSIGIARIQKSMPPEIQEALADLIISTGANCMDRIRASYGKPFDPPTGRRFENPEELADMVKEMTTPQTTGPATKPPNLPPDVRSSGAYL